VPADTVRFKPSKDGRRGTLEILDTFIQLKLQSRPCERKDDKIKLSELDRFVAQGIFDLLRYSSDLRIRQFCLNFLLECLRLVILPISAAKYVAECILDLKDFAINERKIENSCLGTFVCNMTAQSATTNQKYMLLTQRRLRAPSWKNEGPVCSYTVNGAKALDLSTIEKRVLIFNTNEPNSKLNRAPRRPHEGEYYRFALSHPSTDRLLEPPGCCLRDIAPNHLTEALRVPKRLVMARRHDKSAWLKWHIKCAVVGVFGASAAIQECFEIRDISA